MENHRPPTTGQARRGRHPRPVYVEHVDILALDDSRKCTRLRGKLGSETQHVDQAFARRCERATTQEGDAAAQRDKLIGHWTTRKPGVQFPAARGESSGGFQQPTLRSARLAELVN